jgi:hypothetical protein
MRRFMLYALMALAIGYSTTWLDFPKVKADEEFGVCCTYGDQCKSGHILCCVPTPNMADCSPTKKNYCLAACP